MPDIVFTVSTAEKLQRLVTGVSKKFNYDDTGLEWDPVLEDHVAVPNPVSRAQFAKIKLIKQIIAWVKEGELMEARAILDSDLDADLEINLEIT